MKKPSILIGLGKDFIKEHKEWEKQRELKRNRAKEIIREHQKRLDTMPWWKRLFTNAQEEEFERARNEILKNWKY